VLPLGLFGLAYIDGISQLGGFVVLLCIVATRRARFKHL
jgi:hypothetical protein